MKILLFRAQGSSLERFRENYTDRSTELVKVWFTVMQRKYPMINIAIPDFIIHLHTVWMFTMFEELLRHSIAETGNESYFTQLYSYLRSKVGGPLFEI